MKTKLAFLITTFIALHSAFTQEIDSLSRGSNDLRGDCEVSACGDNEFTMYFNGEKILGGKGWSSVQTAKLTLHAGDVITAEVRDWEHGKSGGFFAVIRKGGKIAADVSTFRYSVTPPSDWMTSKSLDNYRQPMLKPRKGQIVAGVKDPKYGWAQHER